MAGLENTLSQWTGHFRHLYRNHRVSFIWSVLILIIILTIWTFLCRRRFRNRRYIQALGFAIIFILILTNLFRTPKSSFEYKLVPFWSYAEILLHKNMFLFYENLANILVYVPVGFFAAKAFPKEKKTAFRIVLGTSIVMELIQFFLRLGLFEWDDSIHNILGGCLGIWIARKSSLKKDE